MAIDALPEEKKQEAMRILRWSHALWMVVIPTLADGAPRSDFETAIAAVVTTSEDPAAAIQAMPNFPKCCSDALAVLSLPQLMCIGSAFFPLQRLVIKTLDRMEQISVAMHIEISAQREAFDVACLGGDPRLVQALWSRVRRQYDDDESAIGDCCPTGMALACAVADRPEFPHWFAEWFQLKAEDLGTHLPAIRYQACQSGQAALVRWLGEEYPIDAEERDAMLEAGWPALVDCCKRGYLDAAKEFVDSVPDGMIYSHAAVERGMLAACENGHEEIVRWIFGRFHTYRFQTRNAAVVAAKGPKVRLFFCKTHIFFFISKLSKPAIASLICRLRKVPRRTVMQDDWFIVRAQWYAGDLQTAQWFVDKYRICACELGAIKTAVVSLDPDKLKIAGRAEMLRDIYAMITPVECSPWSYGCPNFQNPKCAGDDDNIVDVDVDIDANFDDDENPPTQSSAKRRRLY